MLADDTVLPGRGHWFADSDTTVGEHVGFVLARLHEKAIPGLVEALDGETPAMRRNAALSLGLTVDWIGTMPAGDAFGDAVAARLSDPDPGVRHAAAVALGQMDDGRAVAPLVEMLGSADPKVRRWGARGMFMLKQPAADHALFAALTDSDRDVRTAAADSLGYTSDWAVGNRLAGALRSPNPALRASAARAIGRTNDGQVVDATFWPLLDALGDSDVDVRLAALNGLEGPYRLGSRVEPQHVTPSLKDPDPRVRKAAAVWLGMLMDVRGVPALMAGIEDEDTDVAEECKASLRMIYRRCSDDVRRWMLNQLPWLE
jgi:HEAT repeat protein